MLKGPLLNALTFSCYFPKIEDKWFHKLDLLEGEPSGSSQIHMILSEKYFCTIKSTVDNYWEVPSKVVLLDHWQVFLIH